MWLGLSTSTSNSTRTRNSGIGDHHRAGLAHVLALPSGRLLLPLGVTAVPDCLPCPDPHDTAGTRLHPLTRIEADVLPVPLAEQGLGRLVVLVDGPDQDERLVGEGAERLHLVRAVTPDHGVHVGRVTVPGVERGGRVGDGVEHLAPVVDAVARVVDRAYP